MSALPTDSTPNGYSNTPPPNPAAISEGIAQPQEEHKGKKGYSRPTLGFDEIESSNKFILIDLSLVFSCNYLPCLGNPDDAKPSTSVDALEGKVSVLQNKIDSLKVLFTQVLERVNIVNQENNYLRSVIMQNNQVKLLP